MPEEAGFLRRSALFSALADESLAAIYASGETLVCDAGHVVFEEGASGTDLFVVKSGVLEVRKHSGGRARVVSYVSGGECVGEMALITGAPRSATVRVPERAEVFRLSGEVFERLLHQSAELSLGLARVLARRLELANRLQDQGPGHHLAGDLQFFEVAEVCQTLIQSRRTGVMRVWTQQVPGDVCLWFDGGWIRHARAGVLCGRDAALVLLRDKLDGSFEFESTSHYAGPVGEPELEDGSMALLLEAAQQGDEIRALRSRVGAEDVRWMLLGDFPWSGELDRSPRDDGPGSATAGRWHPRTEDERTFAHSVWTELARGRTVAEILAARFGRELMALEILNTLIASGAVVL